jgi:hypothetical protein
VPGVGGGVDGVRVVDDEEVVEVVVDCPGICGG